jgi:hypothetical protein
MQCEPVTVRDDDFLWVTAQIPGKSFYFLKIGLVDIKGVPTL